MAWDAVGGAGDVFGVGAEAGDEGDLVADFVGCEVAGGGEGDDCAFGFVAWDEGHGAGVEAGAEVAGWRGGSVSML